MIYFADGPARGQCLSVSRAPLLLRAVRSCRGNWDALDQPHDEAKPRETAYLYWHTHTPKALHFSGTTPGGGRRKSWWEADATYRLFPEIDQVETLSPLHLKDNAVFADWCATYGGRIRLAWAESHGNPKRIQCKRVKGWRMPPGATKVDRSSAWGNPFPVTETCTLKQSLIKYRAWLYADAERLAEARTQLRGMSLACWCAPDSPCHADILLEVVNA